jgi:DsbC/DsbD-like thiol-disulfide interchange protein
MRSTNATMTARTRWSLAAILLAVTVLSPGRMIAEKPDVHARLEASARLVAGTTLPVVVEMTIGSGWHVNSHTPTEKYLIPTVITLGSGGGTFSPVRYPPDVVKQLAFAQHPLRIYEGTVTFESDFHVSADAAGPLRIAGAAAYQACDDRQCFPPSRIPLEAVIQISPVDLPR